MQLEQVESIRDHGINIDYRLIYKEHVKFVINPANKLLEFVIRNSKFFLDVDIIETLYFSLLFSKIEYEIIN